MHVALYESLSVCQSIGPSVRPLVRRSVVHFKIAEFKSKSGLTFRVVFHTCTQIQELLNIAAIICNVRCKILVLGKSISMVELYALIFSQIKNCLIFVTGSLVGAVEKINKQKKDKYVSER